MLSSKLSFSPENTKLNFSVGLKGFKKEFQFIIKLFKDHHSIE